MVALITSVDFKLGTLAARVNFVFRSTIVTSAPELFLPKTVPISQSPMRDFSSTTEGRSVIETLFLMRETRCPLSRLV